MSDENKKEPGLFDDIIKSSAKEVTYSLIRDTFIPEIKKLISTSINRTVAMFLYGKEASVQNTVADTVSWRPVDYTKASTNKSGTSIVVDQSPINLTSSYFPDRLSAEQAILNLRDKIKADGFLTVAGFKEECGGTKVVSSDIEFGWVDISSARVVSDTVGWYIRMPRATPINRFYKR